MPKAQRQDKQDTDRGKRPTTIADVAKLAGVSIGTVSNVLTGARRVLPQTRLRVEEIIESTQFRPNRAAQALMVRRTGLVGLLIPDVTNPYFAELIHGRGGSTSAKRADGCHREHR